MSLFDHGDEVFKGAVHGATLMLALEMALYNAVVYKQRGTRWHLFTTAVYGSLVVLEVVQVARHTRDTTAWNLVDRRRTPILTPP